MSKTILITGVAGFIGRYVARHFAELGWTVIGTDHSAPENAPLANLATYYQMNLPDPKFSQVLQSHSPDVCLHSAGRASVNLSMVDPCADFHTNTVLTYEILNSIRLNAPACRFIFLSSAAVYGNPESLPVSETQSMAPLSPYGFHKLQCEQLCLEFTKIYDIPTASLRIFSAYGPGLRRQVLWDICRKAISEKTMVLQGTGKESRDFIHAIDIARAVEVVAENAPMLGEAYNLGSGRMVEIEELAEMTLTVLETGCDLQFSGIVPSGTPLNWQADVTKLSNLGFTARVPLERGVKTFANWCLAELIGV